MTPARNCDASSGRSATVWSRRVRSPRPGPAVGPGGRGFRLGPEAEPVNDAIKGIEETRPRCFHRYSAYKDSGIEWLGEVPEHWVTWKATHGFRRIGSGTTPKSDNPEYYNGDISWVTTSELRETVIVDTTKKVTTTAMREYPTLRMYPKGTLLFAMYGATIGRLGILGIAATVNQACAALAEPLHLATWFVYYWLQMRRPILIVLSAGGGQPNLSQDDLRQLRIPAPPLDEQRVIAAFLDRETARIDGSVERKERLIELLQEKRVALITRAVIRGLDPNAPMKDSGVEWLGEIPAHWEVKSLKHLTPGVTVGIVVTPSKYYVEEGVPCLRSLNVSRGAIDMENLVFISENSNELHRKSKIFAGDVVVVRTGQAGTAAVVPKELDGANCIDLLIVRRSEQVLSHFLYYYLNSCTGISQAAELSVGAIQAHYNTSTLARLVVPKIPTDEQSRIVTHLDQATGEIDALIAKIHEAIDHLKEFRTALISAAVTGKIDLREAAS